MATYTRRDTGESFSSFSALERSVRSNPGPSAPSRSTARASAPTSTPSSPSSNSFSSGDDRAFGPNFAQIEAQTRSQIAQSPGTPGLGGSSGGGTGPSGDPQSGDPQAGGQSAQLLQILDDHRSRRLTDAQALQAMATLGYNDIEARRLLRIQPGQQPPIPGQRVSTTTTTGGGNLGNLANDDASVVPTSSTNFVGGSPGFTQLLQDQLAGGDVARRFALESGISPSLRGFVQSQVANEEFPFALQTVMGGDLSQLDQPGAFTDFLRDQGGVGALGSGIGQDLRAAADFLRSPAAGGILSAGQETLNQRLLGPVGSVGSERFDPIIDLLVQPSGRRFLPGLGQAGRTGTRNFLENQLALNPTQFTEAPQFIDFLSGQGLLR